MIKHCFCNYYTNITNWVLEIYPKQSEFRFCFWLFCSDANTTWAQVTSWGYSEVISERQQLSSLVFEVVDKFGIFSILPCQSFLHTYIVYCIFDHVSVSSCVFNISWWSFKFLQKLHLQFKHRCVDGLCSMAFKAINDGVEDFLSDSHLLGVIVSCSLKESVSQVSLYSTKIKIRMNDGMAEWCGMHRNCAVYSDE